MPATNLGSTGLLDRPSASAAPITDHAPTATAVPAPSIATSLRDARKAMRIANNPFTAPGAMADIGAAGLEVRPLGGAALRDFLADDAWRSDGVCTEVDPDLFFPEQGESSREALDLCNSCDVLDACFDWIMSTEPQSRRYGVYAAMTPTERRRLFRANPGRWNPGDADADDEVPVAVEVGDGGDAE